MGKDTKKDSKPANLTTFMLSQDFLLEHWDWTDQEKKILLTFANTPDAAKEVGKIIFDRMLANGINIIEAYAITHNRDEHVIWSEYKNQYITSFTSNHIHFVGKLSKGETLERIAEVIGVAPSFIEKPQRGRYSYDNMLAYLIHIKYPQKYRYGADEVVTFAGKKYFDYYSENHKQWMHGRAERIILEAKITLHDAEMLIMDGKLSRKDLATDPEFRYVFQKHRDRLLGALDRYYQYIQDQQLAAAGRFDELDQIMKSHGSLAAVITNSDDQDLED